MAKNLIINSSLTIPAAEIELSFSRSSGAGGQNVNKVNSKVTLRWDVQSSISVPFEIKKKFLSKYAGYITKNGEYLIHSSVSRDQNKNIDDCLEKLRNALLAASKKDKKRVKTKPSKSSREKRIQSKKIQSKKKLLRTNFSRD